MKMFVLCIALLVFGTLTFADQAVKPVNAKDGIALRGYDVVAYFNNSKAIEGSDEFQHEWNGAKWYFSSASNRDLFAKAPEKYAPQFGGYCAYAASRDYLYDANPLFWRIVDGKLYLNYNGEAKNLWEKDVPGNIKKGNKNWPGLLKGKETK